MTNSATGGYLRPTDATPPLEGAALNDFLQRWIVGISGIDSTLVRPRWQTEPPNIPQAATAWCAVGVTGRRADVFPHVKHTPAGDVLWRHEDLTVLSSFYDIGTDGQAAALATLTRDGISIPQNLEPLTLAGFGLVEAGELQDAPVMFKARWMYRVDLPIVLRRAILRTYAVEDLASMEGALYTDAGVGPYPISATHG